MKQFNDYTEELLQNVLKEFHEDIKTGTFKTFQYLDTWEYEDCFSFKTIDKVQFKFMQIANKFFREHKMPFAMNMVYDKRNYLIACER